MWRILLVCILSVFLSPWAAEAAQEKPSGASEEQKQNVEQIMVPPFDLPEDDIRQMKEKMKRLKPLLEKDGELAHIMVRDVDEIPGVVPRINLAYGYGTVINLPYTFNAEGIVIGAKEKFDVRTKGGSLIIFPIKEFKSTNVVVFEEKEGGGAVIPHHYLLVEDSASGGADLTVNIRKPEYGAATDMVDAVVRTISTRIIPGKGTAEGVLLAGRYPSLTDLAHEYPFVRMMKLSQPDLYVYMIAQRVTPAGEYDFYVEIDARNTIIASRTPGITVRRITDGKTFTKAR